MRHAVILAVSAGLAACGPQGGDASAPAARPAGDGCRIEGRWIITAPSGGFTYIADAEGSISREEYIHTTGTASLDDQSLLIQANDHPLNITIRAELAPDCLTGEGVATAETRDPTLAQGGTWQITVRHECTEAIDGVEYLTRC